MCAVYYPDLALFAGVRVDWDRLTIGGRTNPDVLRFDSLADAERFRVQYAREPGTRVVVIGPGNRPNLAGAGLTN